jgi:iron complex outermembrane recepter protein
MRSDWMKLCLLAVAMSGPFLLPALAEAQSEPTSTAPAGGLEEIVVTAQRREQRLEDVPMSITTFSQEKMDQQGLRSIDDLARLTPGLTFARNGMGTTGSGNDEESDIAIRGIDSTAGTSTTGIYIDDTPIQTRHMMFGTVNPFPALFDLERVEVLKGPQGTLFGAGSEGGTVRFLTPEPSLTQWQVYTRAEFGQIDGGGESYSAGLAVGGPIIEGVLGFRFSLSDQHSGGWVDRVNYTAPSFTEAPPPYYGTIYSGPPTNLVTTERNANWSDTQTARFALKWQPMDGLTIAPSIYVQTLHLNDTAVYWLSISNPSDNVYNNANPQRDSSTDPWYLGAIKVNWDNPYVHLVSNTSYFSRSQHSNSDYSQWINTVFFGNQFDSAQPASSYLQDRQDNFTQEIRASSADQAAPFTWTAGVFYSKANENTTQSIYDPSFTENFGLPPQPGNIIYTQPQFRIIDKQISAFGETNYKFTDTLNFTAGVRVSKVDYTGYAQESGPILAGLSVNSSSTGSEKPVTPRFVLNYQPSKDSLYYASAAKGFRPGGINPALPPQCAEDLGAPIPGTYKSDSLWQYELGSKQTLLDNRLQVNGAIYYLQWKNIQQLVYLNCTLGFTGNLASVTGKGGDIEVTWRPVDDLTLGLTGSYTDSYFDHTVTLGTTNLVTYGDHLAAPPWNVSASGEYVFNEIQRKPYLRLDYQYATAQRSLTPGLDPADAPNSDTTLPGLPEVRILSMRAGVRFSGMDLSLYALNALNYHTPSSISRWNATTPLNGFPYNFDTNYFGRNPIAPLTYGVTMTYRY